MTDRRSDRSHDVKPRRSKHERGWTITFLRIRHGDEDGLRIRILAYNMTGNEAPRRYFFPLVLS